MYRALREALIKGEFAPGERLSIRGIATALGVSAMPVRTCLRRLAAEQCLDTGTDGTAVVPQLRRAEFAEITALRGVLEPMAAARAADLIGTNDLSAITAVLVSGREKRRQGNEGGYQLDNYAFHFAMYRAAQSPLLLSMIETLWVRRSPIVRQALPLLHARGADLHEELILALTARDGERAARLLRQDIETAGAFLIGKLHFVDDAPQHGGIAALKPLSTRAPRRRAAGRR